LDLTEYFESDLPKFQILTDNFEQVHSDGEEYILGINDLERPLQIYDKYDLIKE